MNLKVITLSEKSKIKECMLYDSIYIKYQEIKTNALWQKTYNGCQVKEMEAERKNKGPEEAFGVLHMFIILISVMSLWGYTYVKTHPIVYFKYMQFKMLCQFYLNKAVKKII